MNKAHLKRALTALGTRHPDLAAKALAARDAMCAARTRFLDRARATPDEHVRELEEALDRAKEDARDATDSLVGMIAYLLESEAKDAAGRRSHKAKAKETNPCPS